MILLADSGGRAPLYQGFPLYQLKITLGDCHPVIWRRVVVRANMKLNRFHNVIQTVMGWTNSHLHQFIADNVYYGVPDCKYDDEDFKEQNEKNHTVAELAPKVNARFIYEYDFGDCWEHAVLLEKILPSDVAFKHPICLAGANACPPEDCGGSSGYAEFVAAMADPQHPEHETMREWIGGGWDATAFSVEAANRGLRRISA